LVDVEGMFDQVLIRGAGLGDAYLRVFVDTDGPVPGIADQIREELPNVIDVHLRYEREEAERAEAPLSSLRPREQFLSYYRSFHGAEPDAKLLAAFDEVAAEQEGEEVLA
jgi:hypothetical protein